MTKSFDREPYLKHSNVAPDVTLSDYIARKQEGPPRITFAQWLNNNPYVLQEMPSSRQAFTLEDMQDCWNAAIKHGKIS